MSTVLGTLLLVGFAIVLALYLTYRFVCRWRQRDRGVRSFGVWLRDLVDVAFGLG